MIPYTEAKVSLSLLHMFLCQLTETGEAELTLNIREALAAAPEGPKDLQGLEGQYLYVLVTVEESTGEVTAVWWWPPWLVQGSLSGSKLKSWLGWFEMLCSV